MKYLVENGTSVDVTSPAKSNNSKYLQHVAKNIAAFKNLKKLVEICICLSVQQKIMFLSKYSISTLRFKL